MSAVDRSVGGSGGFLRRFFGVVARKQTYYNLLYLLLAFPLGLAYFVFLVTGFSLALGLAVVLVGFPIAVIVLSVTTHLAAVERKLADSLLAVDVPADERTETDGIVDWLRTMVTDLGTWKSVAYLLSKFFTGMVVFVALVFLGTFVYALVAAPLHYQDPTVGIHLPSGTLQPGIAYQHDVWNVGVQLPFRISVAAGEVISTYADSRVGALGFTAIGVLLGVGVLHVLNAVAWLYGKYTELLLRNTRAHSPR